jgi:cell division protein FtsZ
MKITNEHILKLGGENMIFDELDTFNAVQTKIKVIGVGGAGKNAIDHMIGNHVHGVQFYAVNTDAQDLKISRAENKILIGKTRTHGQGAGAHPEVGREAALESEDDLHEMIGDAEMVFITCGMGGGTGTGAAPVIARIAKEHNCLTIGVCTKPFNFEGPVRMSNAMAGLEEMRQYVDTLIEIPNEKLLQMVDVHTTVIEAFRLADSILRKGVQGIAEIIALPGLINIDFADVRSVMRNKGTALLGIGAARGENRAIEAARQAIHSPLLEITLDGATDAVVCFSSDQNLSLVEVSNAIAEIRNFAGTDLNIFYGSTINNDLGDELVITLVATGYHMKKEEGGFASVRQEFADVSNNENMSDVHISLDSDEPIDTSSEQEARRDELFANPLSEKERKKKEKEEAKRRAQEEKERRKNPTPPPAQTKTKLPDWLRKK